MTRGVHHFIRAFILIGLALYIAYLVSTEHLIYYISPRMAPFVKISAFLLYMLSVHQFYFAIMGVWKKHVNLCSCSHIPEKFSFRSVIMYILFIFPLTLGLLLPDQMLSSVMADQKGMRLSATATMSNVQQVKSTLADQSENSNQQTNEALTTETLPEKEQEAPKELEELEELENLEEQKEEEDPANLEEMEALFPYDPFTKAYAKYAMSIYDAELIKVEEHSFTEILTTLDLYLDNFIGKKIEITGFVYRTDAMNDQQFAVGRFAMICCSADAAPYGVFSEFALANQYKSDEWITVTGTIGKTNFNGFEIMKIDVTSIQKAEAPSEPYVYPNYNFGAE